jgi:hypothetical protein
MNAIPKITVKRKNIQSLIDYCLENKIEFAAKLKENSTEEWEIECCVIAINQAILFGMFLKENHLELDGHINLNNLKTVEKKEVTLNSTSKVKVENLNSLLKGETLDF